MEFQFETTYNQEAVTIMAQALRKTVRKKRSRRSHVFGVIIMILAVLLTLPLGEKEFTLDFKTIVTWLVTAIMLLVLVFEDKLNGYIARKRMLPGLEKATVTFRAEGYCSETEIGKSEFKYNNIMLVAENADYFVFAFSQSHAQVYDKKSMTGGTVEQFREFIREVTGKEVQKI